MVQGEPHRTVKILWLLRRGKLQGGSATCIFAVSCKRKADVLFLLMPHYSGIRSLATVGLYHFFWGFVPGAAQCVLDFTSTVALVV